MKEKILKFAVIILIVNLFFSFLLLKFDFSKTNIIAVAITFVVSFVLYFLENQYFYTAREIKHMKNFKFQLLSCGSASGLICIILLFDLINNISFCLPIIVGFSIFLP
ncbi:MAG: hypothetical protein GX297_07130 [Treponema sp.]|nr:hypothetical protein [Treponema sp.]